MSIATQIERLQDVRNQIRAKMVALGLSKNTALLKDLADDLDNVEYRGDASTTLSTSTRSKTLNAGYYTGGTIDMPNDYFPVTSTNTTATASDVLSGKKFVSTSGDTVTGNIATATSSDVSGSVEGANPDKITLTTANISDSSETTATAKTTVTKGLYTGASNIEADLTPKTFTVTAEATLATSVAGSTAVPDTLPSGTVTITPNTDNTKRIYSGSANNGFITNVVLEAMASSSVTANNPTEDPGTDYTNKSTVTPTKSLQYVKITAGYLPNSKITVNAIPSTTLTVAANAWTEETSVTETGSYTQTVTGVAGVSTDNDIVVLPGNTSEVVARGVYASGQGDSIVTFKAFDKPTSDISYTVYILNK